MKYKQIKIIGYKPWISRKQDLGEVRIRIFFLMLGTEPRALTLSTLVLNSPTSEFCKCLPKAMHTAKDFTKVSHLKTLFA